MVLAFVPSGSDLYHSSVSLVTPNTTLINTSELGLVVPLGLPLAIQYPIANVRGALCVVFAVYFGAGFRHGSSLEYSPQEVSTQNNECIETALRHEDGLDHVSNKFLILFYLSH